MSDMHLFSKVFYSLFAAQRTPEEHAIVKGLKGVFNAKTEVRTPAGVVDLISEDYQMIAEIKKAKNWKHAIGQILIYQYYFPDKTPFIILFGHADDRFMDMVKHHASRFGIAVMFANSLSERQKHELRENRRRLLDCEEELRFLTKSLADSSQLRLEV